jgi:hypothetical protein
MCGDRHTKAASEMLGAANMIEMMVGEQDGARVGASSYQSVYSFVQYGLFFGVWRGWVHRNKLVVTDQVAVGMRCRRECGSSYRTDVHSRCEPDQARCVPKPPGTFSRAGSRPVQTGCESGKQPDRWSCKQPGAFVPSGKRVGRSHPSRVGEFPARIQLDFDFYSNLPKKSGHLARKRRGALYCKVSKGD